MEFPWQGAEINFYVWGAIGAVMGWLAGTLMGSHGKVVRIEEVLVGVFGAVIGGEVVPHLLAGGKGTGQFQVLFLAYAIAGAAFLLVVLRLMRKSVGPLRSGKKPPARRY